MMTEEEIVEMGLALEHSGLNDSEIDEYFEHHGVKGQKWGIRNKLLDTKAAKNLNNPNHPRYNGKRAKAGMAVGRGIRKVAGKDNSHDVKDRKVKDVVKEEQRKISAGQAFLLGGLLGVVLTRPKKVEPPKPKNSQERIAAREAELKKFMDETKKHRPSMFP